ncbi:MAG: ATP-binding cassette domain-containing protein [Sedimentisphaerales bacterium]|nr:ATP-binding cassette domain-containing protein [Sedimentisphaerales bacterium]
MKEFLRVFKYIWPQWPRVVVVVTSAVVVSVLLSVSFLTVIPLLKVMTGQEGLRDWADRKICQWQYGVSFYVPESVDFTGNSSSDFTHSLLVVSVHKDSIAQSAGLKAGDHIIGIGDFAAGQETSFTDLLEQLASTRRDGAALHIKRPGLNEETKILHLNGLSDTGLKAKVIAIAQKAVSVAPRGQTEGNRTKAVMFIILTVTILTVIRCIARYHQQYLAEKVVQVGINHLREDAFVHVINMPVGFFSRERPSDSVSRLIRDTGTMGIGIKVLLGKALQEPLNTIFLLCFAAILDWKLTVIFLFGGPPTLWIVVALGKRMKRASRKSLMAWSQMLSKLQETMAGLKIVKVYNQQAYEQSSFGTINKRVLKQLLKISKTDAATQPIMEVVGMLAGFAALMVGATWVAHNKMEGVEFMTFLILLGAAAASMRRTGDIWNKIQEANAAAERVFAIMSKPLELERPGAVELAPLQKKIEFRNVIFTYPGSERPALNGVNLCIRAGYRVAIVGPNGSGKTTLANLIPRFYDPDEGQVLIDGIDIRDTTLHSLRSQIAMVTQQIVTFNDTIAANIGYGKTGASKQEIIDTAKRAFAHEFIEPLPNGYDTIIGEHGSGLSGGQLQRIVIARAILKNPAILIFDEATSQVDADSEAKIHKALEEIMHDRTSLIIAHRFSTIIAADVIVVMDNGRIIAQGRHEKLMQTCSLYQSLYETQLVRA